MSAEQQQAWLTHWHVRASVDALFADPRRSVVALSYAGCGSSTSLSLLGSYQLLSFPYNPSQWPGQPYVFSDAQEAHFGQWMAHVTYRFQQELRANPERFALLSHTNLEFLCWLGQRYFKPRLSALWNQQVQASLPADRWQPLAEALRTGELNDLYGDSVSDMEGQVNECLDVARRLKWEGIYAAIDISRSDWLGRTPEEREQLLDQLRRLLSSLTALQQPGFGIKMSVPAELLSFQSAQELVRGRAIVSAYDWEPKQLDRMLNQYIADDVSASAAPAWRWQDYSDDFTKIWGAPGPAAVAALAKAIVGADTAHEQPFELSKRLYREEAKLVLDRDRPQRRIWRGMSQIKLDETPFRFFEQLWRLRGDYASNEMLMQLAGSQANLDQNISRIRRAIEPFYKQKREKRDKDSDLLYIERNSQGTRLVKDMCDFT